MNEPPVSLDVGPSVPAWALSIAGFAIAVGCSAPTWHLASIWVALPLLAFAAAACRPSVATMFPALAIVPAGIFFGEETITAVTFISVLGLHLLYIIYSVTAAVPRTARVSIPALKTLGLMALKIQAAAQSLTLGALLTVNSEPVAAVGILGSLGVLALVIGLRRAFVRGAGLKSAAPRPEL